MKVDGRGGGSELGSGLDPDPAKLCGSFGSGSATLELQTSENFKCSPKMGKKLVICHFLGLHLIQNLGIVVLDPVGVSLVCLKS